MTLKRQLFVASLLMLLIPWAGLQFVLELDQALRQQALQQLQDQAERLANIAGDFSLGQPLIAPQTPAIYVENLSAPLNLEATATTGPVTIRANRISSGNRRDSPTRHLNARGNPLFTGRQRPTNAICTC